MISILFMFVSLVFVGCGDAPKQTEKDRGEITVEPAQQKPQFSLPTIPMTIVDKSERGVYLAEHYWDCVDFSDKMLLENDSVMGLAVGGFVQLLTMNELSVVESSINAVLSKAMTSGYESFERLSSLLEDYLYDPNSPMRNEEFFIYVLNYTINSGQLEDIYKIRSRSQLKMVLKNRVGDTAANFDYEVSGGVNSSMHSIKSAYTILFFNTPDCEDCARVKDFIAGSPLLSNMVSGGELTILGIYAEHDMALWRAASYPFVMVNGADTKGKISKERLYDLRALPTLYLLDANKKVILKDRTIEEVCNYLQINQ